MVIYVTILKKALKKGRDFSEKVLTIITNLIIAISKETITNLPKRAIKNINSFYQEIKNALGESFIALSICAISGLFAGILLTNMGDVFAKFPGIFVLIPGAIAMRGNIFGALGSRLSSELHIGILSPELKKSPLLKQSISSSIILTFLLSLLLAFASKGLCEITGQASMQLFDFIIISILAGLISSLILLPLTIIIALKSYENGWDPDNVTTPLIAALGDLFTIPSLMLSLFILNLLDYLIIKIILVILFIFMAILFLIRGLQFDDYVKTVITESTPILILCSILGTGAGTILNSKLSLILNNPSVLTLVPLFSGQSGNLISILGARLSSGLHSGNVEVASMPKKGALINFAIILILGLIIYPLIGVLVHISTITLGITSLGLNNIVLISLFAGCILIPFIMIISYYLSYLSYKEGLNPDNIVIPLSTSITDLLANFCLILVVMIFLGIPLTSLF